MAGAIIRSLDGAHGIPGWRWLFIIEGIITVVCGWGLYFVLPDYPRNSRFLSPEQRQLAHIRILYDRNLTAHAASRPLTSWQAFKAVIADFRTWVFVVIYKVIILGMSISYFIPSILTNMGYTSVTAQWMTVPIWVTGAVAQLTLSYSSDKMQDRRWHNFGLYTLAGVACIVSAVIESNVAKYVMMCFLVAGLYTALPLVLNWASECIAFPDQKRSVAIAFINSFGHLAIIYGSYLWPSTNAPQHLLGFATLAATCALGAVLVAAYPYVVKLLPNEPATKAERRLVASIAQESAAMDGDELMK